MTGIIDYGAGNLRSVFNAFRYIGQQVRICTRAEELADMEKIVLPGVGSSGDAMMALAKKGFDRALKKYIAQGRPFLGICLGLQLLFEKSHEAGGCDCLRVVKGEVRGFSPVNGLKVPQIGWNNVSIKKAVCPLFNGIKDNSFFYFVHSYYCDTGEPEYTAGETSYGLDYTSVLWKENIFAVQFHPERSQDAGLKLLENFSAL
jgi:glutamine amidotransferase